ncbi:MAG: putative quinol monooxygenase [Syntrophales bacterium]
MVVVAILKARQGVEKDMEAALRAMVPKVLPEEGTLTYILNRAQNEPGKFLFYEKYTNKAAFDIHSSTPHFQELFEKIAPMLDGEPSLEMYEELAAKA